LEILPQDIAVLNRYFSIKTLFDLKLDCHEDARQLLQASLTDPAIRHALWSLRALREDLETSGDNPESLAHQTKSYHYGLHQYGAALGDLASNISSPSPSGLKSALLCCQIFIGIEELQKNYAAMVQHIVRGLKIMHEYRARPSLVATNEFVPAHEWQLPFVDVFIIKLFLAPCKSADAPATAESSGKRLSALSMSLHPQPVASRDLRTIAPDMWSELTRIASWTLDFLSKVSQADSVEVALRLLRDKKALLDSLESWLIGLELVQTKIGPHGPEPVSVSFWRLFHLILKIVLLGALESSPDLVSQARTESDQLQNVANTVSDRLRTYRTCRGTVSGQMEPLPTTVR